MQCLVSLVPNLNNVYQKKNKRIYGKLKQVWQIGGHTARNLLSIFCDILRHAYQMVNFSLDAEMFSESGVEVSFCLP